MIFNYRYLSLFIIILIVVFGVVSFNIKTKFSDTSAVFDKKSTVKNVHSVAKILADLVNQNPNDVFNSGNLTDVTNDEYDLSLPSTISAVLSPSDKSKQAKLDIERRLQQILQGRDEVLEGSVINIDFTPDLKVGYRQKFNQAKNILFNVKTSNKDYQLKLKRNNFRTNDGDWYSGYVKNTDTKALVKAFSDRVAIYIYEPKGRIKISKTLNEKQKYMDSKKLQPLNEETGETMRIQSSFFETLNDYYIVDASASEYAYESEIYKNKIHQNGENNDNDFVIKKGKK
ncbi:MAG: hypothetical protein FE834_03380 [Gammaproteobacteria bacterium]|nr:hypothetical protein [Gammaproteobacteria bacterium]